VTRRRLVRERVDAFNGILERVCARYGKHCKWDGGAVHRAGFGLGQLSALDFFHPNTDGQNQIAKVTYPTAFDW
jgi:hypothetical protein